MTNDGETLAPDDRPTDCLLQELRNGDRDAFTALYNRHAPAIRRSLRRRMGTLLRGHICEDDAVQEGFVAAWRYVASDREAQAPTVGSFRHLVVKIALQKARDHARTATRLRRDAQRTLALDSDVAAAGHRPSEVARGEELDARREAVLASLDEADRWLIDCRDNLGMSFAEIATELGCKPANAKLKHHRAMQRYRAALRPFL